MLAFIVGCFAFIAGVIFGEIRRIRGWFKLKTIGEVARAKELNDFFNMAYSPSELAERDKVMNTGKKTD